MRRSAIILAGALAFDLGVVVVAARSAENTNLTNCEASAGRSGGGACKGKHFPDELLLKIDRVNTADACKHKGGTVLTVSNLPVCQLPAPAAASDRWTPVVPRPQETR